MCLENLSLLTNTYQPASSHNWASLSHWHRTNNCASDHTVVLSTYASYWGQFCMGFICYLEKAMAPHSSTLAWKIPWTEELGRLQSMGLQRVGHDWVTSLSLFTFMHWRRKWQSTPVSCLENPRDGSPVGCCLWGRTESDTTDVT